MHTSASSVSETGAPFYQEVRNDGVKGQKPLLIALVILGVVGLGIAGTGFASLGAHQGWWAAGGLSSLSQIKTIVMISVGGAVALLTIGMLRVVKENQTKSKHEEDDDTVYSKTKMSEARLGALMGPETYTFVPQKNNKFSMYSMDAQRTLVLVDKNLDWDNLSQVGAFYQNDKAFLYCCVSDEVRLPIEIVVSLDELRRDLPAEHYTFVPQRNKYYSLVVQYPSAGNSNILHVIWTNILSENFITEAEKFNQSYKKNYQLFELTED